MTKFVYTFGGKTAEGKADMKNLDTMYLDGRFSAVPVFTPINFKEVSE